MSPNFMTESAGSRIPLPRAALRLAIAGLAAWSAVSSFAAAPASDNLARGRVCRFDPAPGYRYCTDPADARQLTDGTNTTGYFWTQKGTVGWNHARPAVIRLDLGRIEPIRAASFRTAAGTAGVQWPDAIFVLVSDDGSTWREAAELVSASAITTAPPAQGYAVHTFRSDALRAHGRYVAFVVSAAGYAFTDEIEVLRGDPAWLADPPRGPAFDSPQALFRAAIVRQSVLRRLHTDARAVRDLAISLPSPATAAVTRFSAELDKAAAGFDATADAAAAPGFRALLPMGEAHRLVFRAQAGIWRAAGLPELSVLPRNPWDPPAHTGMPPPAASGTLRADLMRNEYRAAAFDIVNAGDRDLDLRLRFEGLPGATNGGWIAVHQVEWTDTASGHPVAAALPLAPAAGDGWAIRAHAGLIRQVWLTIHPTDVQPGMPAGRAVLEGGPATVALPVEIRIRDRRFPDRPRLHIGGWDYTDVDARYEITPTNRAAVIAHLRDRFVDSPWASSKAMPFGAHDAEGRMTATPDTTIFDTWVRRWPGAGQYCVFASVGDTLGGLRAGTPAFDAAVGAWIRFWADHARTRGLRPDQLAVLLVDEPHEAAQDRRILVWARTIRAAATGVKIWEDPTHTDPAKAEPGLFAACDVLCPNRPMFLSNPRCRAFWTGAWPAGVERAFYSCSGPARLLDPYAYHRLQAWTAWQNGAQSSFFWAFGDAGGGSSWNEYAGARSSYTPLFLDTDSVTAGRHMEAIRESAEDFECLAMLRDAVTAAERRGAKGPEVARGRALLAGAADRVCGAAGAERLLWHEAKDRSVADVVRVEILDALDALDAR